MKTTAFVILCVIGTIAISANVSFAASESRSAEASSGVLMNSRDVASGEKIQVKIYFPTASGTKSVYSAEIMIGADGKADLPEIGRVEAAGLTSAELARDIKRRFSEVRGKGAEPTVVISKANIDGLSLQSAVAEGRVERRVDSRPALLDAPGPQYRDLKREESR